MDDPLGSIALAVDGLFALQIEGIVSVGHQALLVGLHGLGEDLEVRLSEAAITQGTQRQDALQQSVHLGDGVLDLAAQDAGHQLLELHDLAVGLVGVIVVHDGAEEHVVGDIRQGKLPQDFTERKADRSYFEAGSEHIPKMIEQITSAALRSQIPARDIQVLAPMYKGQAGIDNINTLMQDLLNPAIKDQVVFDTPDCQYRDGDKVIHLVNDAESNVFNGDIGYITDLLPGKYTESKQDELTIQFDGNEIVYPRNEWYKIRLAYAMSIHKSQGSEFPVVILPITNQSHRMLQRNLIYTAITRSKSKLILLGEYSAFDYATKNTGTARKTYLVERFKDLDGVEATKASSSVSPIIGEMVWRLSSVSR